MTKKTKAPKKKDNPYAKFMEDPEVRQFMYGLEGTRDRNEGGMPSGHPAFDSGYMGMPIGTNGLDIDAANFEMWKRKQVEQEALGQFWGNKSSPSTVRWQDIFAGSKNNSKNWYFGNPGRN